MLPGFYRDIIDSWETDFETMDGPKFLVRCEQIKVKDHKDRKECQDNKDKLKCKAGAAKDENANATRNQKSVKKKYKSSRCDKNSITHGITCFCKMCKHHKQYQNMATC